MHIYHNFINKAHINFYQLLRCTLQSNSLHILLKIYHFYNKFIDNIHHYTKYNLNLIQMNNFYMMYHMVYIFKAILNLSQIIFH